LACVTSSPTANLAAAPGVGAGALGPVLAQLVDAKPTADTRLRRPFDQLELAIDRWTTDAKLAS